MAVLKKTVKLYKPGVEAHATAGTDAELTQLKLQGWSEKKPETATPSTTPASQAGGKKN